MAEYLSQEVQNPNEIKLHLLDYWRVLRIRLPLIILVFLLVVITVGVVTYFTPRQYLSSVTLQVKEDNNNLRIFGGEGGQRADPRFATTQFQIIQRKEILYPVIDSMKLVQKWDLHSNDEAYMRLRSMLTVSEVRNTDLLQISVLDHDRVEAAELANTIAIEYQKRRISEEEGWLSRSLVQLEDEVNKQRFKTEELRDEMAKIRQEAHINDLNPESTEDPRMMEDASLISDESQVNEMRLKVAGLRSKEKQIETMSDDQIIRSLKTFEMDDATINQIFPEYEACVSEEAHMLSSGLGPNHPTVKSLEAKKAVFQKQLQDEIGILRKSLAANLQISESSLAAMEQKLEEAKTGQQNAKSRSVQYEQAKNEYLKAKRILESAESRYSTEAMQRTMPQSPATIWEKAEISDYPAKPRVAVNMAVGVAVGLVMGVGLAFLLEYLDKSVKTIYDLESAFEVPVLAVIPRGADAVIDSPSDAPVAEGYRIMRANILLNRKTSSSNTITAVSGGEGEGKSTTINNLAFTFAKGGYKTLIIDADLRRPSQHYFFGLPNDHGLADFLTEEVPYQGLIKETGVKNLFILPSGVLPSEEVDILNAPRMSQLIKEAKATYDMVLIDSPPILIVSDASVIASAVDMCIVVVEYRRFPGAMLRRLRQRLNDMGATIIGSVLNSTDLHHMEHYEYYSADYYSYYHPGNKNAKKPYVSKRKPSIPPKVKENSKPASPDSDEEY